MFPEKLLIFSRIVGQLKKTKRLGWISHAGIRASESVADHSFRCAVLAMCLGDLLDVDTDKLIRMMLLHDIQEALTGDYDAYKKKQLGSSKIRSNQKAAIEHILSYLSPKLRNLYLHLWEEFHTRKTTEAILANDIDKIEMVMQALEYEEDGHNALKLQTFWKGQNDIETPLIQHMYRRLKELKKELKKGK